MSALVRHREDVSLAGREESGTAYVSAPTSREFAAIAAWCEEAYDIEDYALVLAYLRRCPSLLLPLRLIPDQAEALLAPQSRPRLRMVVEDEPARDGFLVAAVPTALDVPEASRILDALDEAWWLEQSRSLSGRLVLTVDYL